MSDQGPSEICGDIEAKWASGNRPGVGYGANTAEWYPTLRVGIYSPASPALVPALSEGGDSRNGLDNRKLSENVIQVRPV